ncbi:hypothetical protein RKE25_23290 (plasmid) [Dyella sp. BiH032]|uniref:hypothetical protein n=1 Tax=Dyella sp. BiH032 TaxID=3075430 RepID=UPI0028929D8E|nr:hypothetical protein [Dyella sp. BiH032]WNL48541.1 hypothetical protein RKE25_23290 [Dyella sp. BiH032]
MLYRDEILMVQAKPEPMRYRGCGRTVFTSYWEEMGFPFPRSRVDILERMLHTSRAYTTRWQWPVGGITNTAHYSVVLGGRHRVRHRPLRQSRKPMPEVREPPTTGYARLIGEDAAMTLARP